MSSRLWYAYLIGSLALFLLFFLVVPYYSQQIPSVIENTAKRRLSDIKADWASVQGIDRDLLLTGQAPTIESHQATLDTLRQISIIRNIFDQTTQKTISPYTMNLEWNNEELSLTGFLPNEKSQQAVAKLLKQKYADKTILQNISLAQGHPKQWTKLITTILNQIPLLNRADVDLVDKNLGVSGHTQKTSDKKKLLQYLQSFQAHGYELELNVVAGDVAKIRCQQQFDTLLSNNQILFDSGKASIKASSYPLLNQLVALAGTCPLSALEIVGHADNQGRQEKNLLLSQQRARSVAQWLIKSGVSQHRLKTVGYGAEKPIGDNRTAFGRARNRRIEFIVRSN